jgi:TonB family protein
VHGPVATLLLLGLAQSGENVREAPPQPPPHAAELTRAPSLIEPHAADYPPERLARGEEADVACLVDIDADGRVADVVVERSAAPDFDAAAVAAIRSFRFSPAEIDGKPASVRIRYVYHFVVRKQPAPSPEQGADEATLRGTVLEAGTRRPVAGADVFAGGAQAAADAQGRFELRVPAGEVELRAGAPGFGESRRRMRLEARAAADVTLYLRRTEVGDYSAVVEGSRPEEAPTRRTLRHDELVNVPGSLNDPIRVVQNLPGVNRAPYLGGALLVRGTPPADTGIYLDGQRIPILYHFLGGPSVINEQLLDRIDFYPGGYGAYYGRNLTGAIDVGTRQGDPQGFHGSVSVDLLQSVAFVEAPLGERTQVAVAARRSYIDLFLPLFLPNDPKNGVTSITPVYWDYQARLDHKLLNGDELTLFAFGTDDSLALIQKGGSRNQPLQVNSHTAAHQLRFGWRHAVSDAVTLRVAPLLGLTVQSFDATGAGTGSFGLNQSGRIFDWTFALRADARWQVRPWLSLRAGLDLAWDRYVVNADIQSTLQIRQLGPPITQEQQISHTQPLGNLGEFAEGELKLGRWELHPGLRLDQFHWREHTYGTFDPRLWARYALTDATGIKGYAGLYHQAPSPFQLDPALGNPALLPQRAFQVGLGVDHRFGGGWSASIDGFYDRRSSLASRVPAETLPDGTVSNPLYLNQGLGRSYGIEVLVRRDISARFYGWVAYTLSRSDLLPRNDVDWRAFNFDQPHNLIVVAGYRPSPAWELSARYRFVSGNPTAPVTSAVFDADSGRFNPDSGNLGDTRLPAFSQFDARAQYTWTSNLWQLSAYLDVQNLLNHSNEELHVWDYRYRQQGSISGLPVLPTLGVKVRW